MTAKGQAKNTVTSTQTHDERKVPCEVYSRIVGYLRPVRNWNDGKQQEFEDRTTFNTEPK
jgi:anaerobic ribonucleoside-triphosphate reductase